MKQLSPLLQRPTLDDPLYAQKNPHQTFLLIFSLYTSIPLVLGMSTGSGRLDVEVDHVVILFWGIFLLLGSIIALVGEFWPGRTYTALVLERTGVSLVGIGALFYAIVIAVSVPLDETRFLVGIVSAYGLSCLWRFVQISRRLRWLRGLIAEVYGHEQ